MVQRPGLYQAFWHPKQTMLPGASTRTSWGECGEGNFARRNVYNKPDAPFIPLPLSHLQCPSPVTHSSCSLNPFYFIHLLPHSLPCCSLPHSSTLPSATHLVHSPVQWQATVNHHSATCSPTLLTHLAAMGSNGGLHSATCSPAHLVHLADDSELEQVSQGW